jgi:hypothetical protein
MPRNIGDFHWTQRFSDVRRWTPEDVNRLPASRRRHAKIEYAVALAQTSSAVELQARKHGIKIREVKHSLILPIIPKGNSLGDVKFASE